MSNNCIRLLNIVLVKTIGSIYILAKFFKSEQFWQSMTNDKYNLDVKLNGKSWQQTYRIIDSTNSDASEITNEKFWKRRFNKHFPRSKLTGETWRDIYLDQMYWHLYKNYVHYYIHNSETTYKKFKRLHKKNFPHCKFPLIKQS